MSRSGRELQPFASRSLSEWLDLLAAPVSSVEDQFRAFLAISALGAPQVVAPWAKQFLLSSEGDLRAAALRWYAQQWPQGTAVPDTAVGAGAAADGDASPEVVSGQAAAAASVTVPTRAEIEAALRQAWNDPDPDVQLESVSLFSQCRPESTEHAKTVMELAHRSDAEPLSQARLAKLIGRLSSQRTAAPSVLADSRALLTEWLSAEQVDLREAAATALAASFSAADLDQRTCSAATLSALMTASDDEEPFVREHAIAALGAIRPRTEAIVRALETASQDDDEQTANLARDLLAAPSDA